MGLILFAAILVFATGSALAAASRLTVRPRTDTPCLESGGRIASDCVPAVERARASLKQSAGGSSLMTPLALGRSMTNESPSVEGGGNTLAVGEVGDGTTTQNNIGAYSNLVSIIWCGTDPALTAGEIYASCAKIFFTDAETGSKTTSKNESTDTFFDACGKLMGGSHEIGWKGESGEIESGKWIGGADQSVPSTDATACPGVWTVVYSFTQTFKNNVKLTAESSGTFSVPFLPTVATREELYGKYNPAFPNYVQSCAGKPVDCATGNESLSQTDLTTGGRGVPLTFSRNYNSQGAVSQGTHGLMGYGWTPSFSDHLSITSSEGKTSVTVVQANGSTVTFTGTGTPGALTGPKWGQAKLVLNEGGTYTYTLPSQEALNFSSSGLLLSAADRNGNTTTMNRNAEGRLESVTDAAGRKMSFAYNAEGMIESVTDPMGHVVKYTYEGGELATVTLPGETKARWRFKYDSAHRITSIIDGRGGTTTTEYDASNRVISQTDPAGRTTKFEYTTGEKELPETKITNQATGAVTQEKFTAGWEPTSITRGFGTTSAITETSAYDEAGDLIEVGDGNGHITEYKYDSQGNRTSIVDPDKNETKWTYDSTHDVLTTTTPKGETTTIKRDSHGNPEVMERPAPGGQTQVTRYKYNSLGELESVTDPLERTTKYEYDSQGDRTAEIDPEGNKRTWEYNEDSQEIATVSPRGNAVGGEPAKFKTSTERDAQGRGIKVTDPLGHETKYAFDGDGNLESVTDALGHTTKYTYNADNELTKVEQPNGATAETSYDGAGQMTSQTDGIKHTTKYTRNVLEQVTEVIDPLGRKTTKEYDKAGNLTKVTDPLARISTRVYDAANHLKEIIYTSGHTEAKVQYEYDADGNRTKMVDSTGTSTYAYDQLDRLTETKDGHGNVVKYEYDLDNEQTKITYPNSKVVTRTFDKDGRLQKVTDWLEHTTTFSYNADSNQTGTVWPTGSEGEDKYSYNEADQINEIKMTKGTETLASLAYTHDADGQIKTIASKGLPGEEAISYEYDLNNRLTKGAGLTYEYDAANNPTKTGPSTNTFDEADQLKTGTNVTYTYDAAGERIKSTPTTGVTLTYGYGLSGALTSVEGKEVKKSGFTETYTYDGNNLRASQTVGGVQSFLAWDTTESVPLLLNDGTNSYIYGPGGLPIEQINGESKVFYLHHDQQGSTRMLTGSTGAKEATFTYDAYGNTTGATGAVKTALGYDAQLTGASSGLIYLRARTYDPKTAQFLSVDPVAEVTREPYAYGADNPLAHGDATGLLCGAEQIGISLPGPSCKAIGEGVEEGVNAVGEGIETVEHFVAAHAGTISAVTGSMAVALAATGVAAPLGAALAAVSAATGAYASGEEAAEGKYLAAALDALGSVLGGAAKAEELLGALAAEHDFSNTAESARSLAQTLDKIGDAALAASILNALSEHESC
jgi:RHS repeat-associated protein